MKKRLLLAILTFAMLLLCTGCSSESKLLETLDEGEAYFQDADYEAALTAFEKALKMDDENVYANAMVATLLFAQGDAETAQEYQASALALFAVQAQYADTVQEDIEGFFDIISNMYKISDEDAQALYIEENETEIVLYDTLLEDAIAFWGVRNHASLQLDETATEAAQAAQQSEIDTLHSQLVYAYCYVLSYFDEFTEREQLAILSRTAVTGNEGVIYYNTDYLETTALVSGSYDFVGIQEDELEATLAEVFADAFVMMQPYPAGDKDMAAVLSLAYPALMAEVNTYYDLPNARIEHALIVDDAELLAGYTLEGITFTFAEAVAVNEPWNAWPENVHVQTAVYMYLKYFEEDMIEMATQSMGCNYLSAAQLELLDCMGSLLYYHHATQISLLNLNEKLEMLYACHVALDPDNAFSLFVLDTYEGMYTDYKNLVAQNDALERYVLPS